MRVVKVPWTDRWLTRFNRRFSVEKEYNGHFNSRLGKGYCVAGQMCHWRTIKMEYTFLDQPEKGKHHGHPK